MEEEKNLPVKKSKFAEILGKVKGTFAKVKDKIIGKKEVSSEKLLQGGETIILNNKKNKFKENLKTYSAEEDYKEISTDFLKTLGINEQILNNPVAFGDISAYVLRYATRELNKVKINALNAYGYLYNVKQEGGIQELKNAMERLSVVTKEKMGDIVDPKTGKVVIDEYQPYGNLSCKKQYSIDTDGNLKLSADYNADKVPGFPERTETINYTSTYDKNGIELKRQETNMSTGYSLETERDTENTNIEKLIVNGEIQGYRVVGNDKQLVGIDHKQQFRNNVYEDKQMESYYENTIDEAMKIHENESKPR